MQTLILFSPPLPHTLPHLCAVTPRWSLTPHIARGLTSVNLLIQLPHLLPFCQGKIQGIKSVGGAQAVPPPPVRVYPSFPSMKQLGVLITTLPWMQIHCKVTPHSPVFHQASLMVCRYPLILLGRERHCGIEVFCLRTQHKGPFTQVSNSDLSESWALTTRPQHLPLHQKRITYPSIILA